jgi:hypothetical protein
MILDKLIGEKKMKNEKILAVFAVTIIALSGLGYAFAHWEDEVYVDVDVYTGVLELVFVNPGQQIFVWLDEMWVPQEQVPELKQIMECTIEGTGDLVDPYACELGFEHPCPEAPSGWKNIHMTWTHVYPETAIRYWVEVHNIGTIPAHWIGAMFHSITIDLDGDGPDAPIAVSEADLATLYGVHFDIYAEFGGYVYTLDDIAEGVEPQIHPCEGLWLYVDIYCDDNLWQNVIIDYYIDLEFAQYNWASVEPYIDLPADLPQAPAGGG